MPMPSFLFGVLLLAYPPLDIKDGEIFHGIDHKMVINMDHDSLVDQLRKLCDESVDPGIQARCHVRLSFLELYCGRWGEHWKSHRVRAEEYVKNLKQPDLVRAEVDMFLGYLDAMFFDKPDEGIARVKESICAFESLHDLQGLTKAHYLLGRLEMLFDKELQALETLHKSASLGESSNEFAWTYQSLNYALILEADRKIQNAETKERLQEALNKARSAVGLKPIHNVDLSNGTPESWRALLDSVKERLLDGTELPHIELEECEFAAHNLISSAITENDWDTVAEYNDVFAECARRRGNSTNLLLASVNSSLVDAAFGDAPSAENKLEAAIEGIDDRRKEILAAQFYHDLANALRHGGNERLARQYTVRSSMYQVKSRLELNQSVMQSAKAYAEKQLVARNYEMELRTREAELQASEGRMWLGLIVTPFMLASVFLAASVYQNRRARKNLESDVEQRTASLRHAKEEAELLQIAADNANRQKTEYLERINHELRNPLTSIVATAELLANAGGQVSLEAQATLSACTSNLLDVVDDVLDFTRIESGSLTNNTVETSLSDLLLEVEAITRPRVPAEVDFDVQFPADLPQQILVDGPKLRQLLLNLLSNAARHTTKGTLKLVCEADKSHGEAETTLRFKVSDTGAGVRAEDPFQKYRTDANHPGSGLGLYISKAFVTCMEGELTYESKPGVGTTFHCRIPVTVVTNTYTHPIADAESISPRILVVDDQELNRRSVARLLQSLSFEVQAASTWTEVESIIEQGVDIVFMDLHMPGVDGFEMTNRIRKMNLKPPRILAMTGDATQHMRDHCKTSGFDGFLAKPFTANEIRNAIES
ncbi:MAG: response regulator [Planctomycetota bacterium]